MAVDPDPLPRDRSDAPSRGAEAAGENGLAQEVTAGKDPATPFIALGGTALLIAVLFAVAVGIAALAYVLASG